MSAAEALPYTTRLRVALALARGIAAAHGDVDLTPLHAALGILREGQNAGVAMLAHAEVPWNGVRHELEGALGEPGRPRPEEVVLPLTDGERHLVDDARRQAVLLGDPFVGPQHLLLALLHVAAGPVAEIFLRHGLTHEAALSHLSAVSLPSAHSPEASGPAA